MESDRRCLIKQRGKLVCDEPLRAILFYLKEKEGLSGHEIKRQIDNMKWFDTYYFPSIDADLPPCTTCPIYSKLKRGFLDRGF